MAAVFASPLYVPVFAMWDNSGIPLSGGLVYTYVAGTSTPLATYPTYADALAGTNPNSNPVTLDAYGRAAIWLTPAFYKIIVTDSAANIIWTVDNVDPAQGVPYPYPSEWVTETNAVAYASGTSFTVSGNQTGTYTAGRRVRVTDFGGTKYGTVVSSGFGTSTTVTIINDAAALSAPVSSVAYGWNSYANPSYLSPRTALLVNKNVNQTGFAAATKATGFNATVDTLSEWDGTNSRWVAKYAGNYQVTLHGYISDTVASQLVQMSVYRNGVQYVLSAKNCSVTATTPTTFTLSVVVSMTAGQYLEMFITGTANTTANALYTMISVIRIP